MKWCALWCTETLWLGIGISSWYYSAKEKSASWKYSAHTRPLSKAQRRDVAQIDLLEVPNNAREAGCSSWALFLMGEITGPGGSSYADCASLREGQCLQNVAALLIILMQFFSVSVAQGHASSSFPGSDIFTVVSCLSIVVIWSSCEETEVKNDLCCHLDDLTPSL